MYLLPATRLSNHSAHRHCPDTMPSVVVDWSGKGESLLTSVWVTVPRSPEVQLPPSSEEAAAGQNQAAILAKAQPFQGLLRV